MTQKRMLRGEVGARTSRNPEAGGRWYIEASTPRRGGAIVCACVNSWASGLRRPVDTHVGVGHCEATLPFSVISHRRLGGSPDCSIKRPM